jgi:hypothetical protein
MPSARMPSLTLLLMPRGKFCRCIFRVELLAVAVVAIDVGDVAMRVIVS